MKSDHYKECAKKNLLVDQDDRLQRVMFFLFGAHIVQMVYYTPLISQISYVTKTRYRIFWIPITLFNLGVAGYAIANLVDIK